jgi:hypothetical protein
MIVNNAIQPFTAGAENRVPHHNSIVGAGLVPARDAVLTDDGAIVGALAHDVVPVNTRATTRVAPTLGDVIGAYKSVNRIRQYILDNPQHWHEDRYNPNVREGDE